MKEFFFAVIREEGDNADWSYGFTDLGEAVEAVDRLRNREHFPDAYIAVIDKSGKPECIDRLKNFFF